MNKRSNENKGGTWLRNNRFYRMLDNWYFTTREGIDFGPFDSQNEAENQLRSYISNQQKTA